MRWGAAAITLLFVFSGVAAAQPAEPAQPYNRYQRYNRYRPKQVTKRPLPAPAKLMWLDFELGYRYGVGGNAGRVPSFVETPTEPDTSSTWDRAGRSLTLETRLVMAKSSIFATARYEGYHSTRPDASPRAYTLGFGFGKMAAGRYKGGVARPMVDYGGAGPVDRWGRPCRSTGTTIRGQKIYPRGCYASLGGGDVRPGAPIAYGPGKGKGYFAGWGGWRQVNDFLHGEEALQTNPLGSAGGPVVGVQAMAHFGPVLAATFRHEFFYYLTGVGDNQGSFGYAGRVAAGLRWFLVELQWRADHGTGGEFTLGLIGRVPIML